MVLLMVIVMVIATTDVCRHHQVAKLLPETVGKRGEGGPGHESVLLLLPKPLLQNGQISPCRLYQVGGEIVGKVSADPRERGCLCFYTIYNKAVRPVGVKDVTCACIISPEVCIVRERLSRQTYKIKNFGGSVI